MKLGTILKQGFAFFFAAMICGLGARALMLSIHFPQKVLPASELYLLGVLGIIVCVLWGLYCAMCEQYGNLEHAPLYGLVFLLITSGILNVTGLYETIYYRLFLWVDPQFFTFLFKNGTLLSYVCAIFIFPIDTALQVAKWGMTVHTLQALKKQLWDKTA